MTGRPADALPLRPACPACGRPRDVTFRPFCSRRCRDLDLHRWLAGAYRVPVVEAEPDDEDPRPANER